LGFYLEFKIYELRIIGSIPHPEKEVFVEGGAELITISRKGQITD
jgi:hypothetical protein